MRPSHAVLTLAFVLAACSRGQRSGGEAGPVAPAVDGASVSEASEPLDLGSTKVEVPFVTISAATATTIHVGWKVPPGTALNAEAPFHVRWTTSEGLAEAPEPMKTKGKDVMSGFDVRVVAIRGAPEALLVGELDLVVCDSATHSVCVPVKRRLEMPFLVTHGKAEPRVEVSVPLPRAKPSR